TPRLYSLSLHDALPILGKMAKDWNHLLGILPGFLSGIVLLAFLFTLLVALPLSPYVRQMVGNSKMGVFLVSHASGLDSRLNVVRSEEHTSELQSLRHLV